MRLKTYLKEGITLKQETADKINQLGKDPEIKKLAHDIVMYKKNDKGLALARVIAVNLLNDFILALGSAYEAGKKFDIDKEFSKKKYQRLASDFLENSIKEYARKVHKKLYSTKD